MNILLLKLLKQWIIEKIICQKSRSGGLGWTTTRNNYIQKNPKCEICGYLADNNDVHHIIPRHIDPSRITDPTNLITLCRKYECHLRFGHFGNYTKYYNTKIREMFKNTGEIMYKAEIDFKTKFNEDVGKK